MLAERLFDQVRQEQTALVLAELDARSRRLEQTIGKPSRFTFVLDGHAPGALMIRELEHEVRIWRWDESTGRDQEMMRGTITATQDTLSEQRHTVTFTAEDALGILDRRWLTLPLDFLQAEQDAIAAWLLARGASDLTTSGGVPFGLGSYLPLAMTYCNPAGGPRDPSGRLRDRSYVEGTNCLEALGNLSNVIDGFDFDCRPVPGSDFEVNDHLRIFYPYQGRLIDGWILEFGSTVASLSRSVSSDTFANYVRVIGQSEEDEPQLYGEVWVPTAGDIITNPAGVWMQSLSAADVTVQSTLIEQAAGTLEASILLPSYSLVVVPGVYSPDLLDVGDTVRLRIESGRLHVDTWVRVVARTWDIGDDGEENVEIEVVRPEAMFSGLFTASDQRLKALERR
jgi:hypothetical protein